MPLPVVNPRLRPGAGLTVPVDVHGARVPLAVVVRVDLCRVVHIRAVVTAVPDLILVVVELAGVEEKLTVVLGKRKGRSRDPRGNCAGLQVAQSRRSPSPSPVHLPPCDKDGTLWASW